VQSGELFLISGDNPVLIDGFLDHAIEIDVDAVADHTGESLSPASWNTSRRPGCIRAIPPAPSRPIR